MPGLTVDSLRATGAIKTRQLSTPQLGTSAAAGTAGGGLSGALSGFGGPAAMAAGMAGGIVDSLSPTPQGFDQAYQQPKGLGYADTASDLALASGHPIAMGVGGAYKLAKAATGDFGQKDRFKAEQQRRKANYYGAKAVKEQKRIMSGFNTSGVMNSEMYEYGGPLGGFDMPEYIEFEGPSHAEGGIDFKGAELEGGEVMYNNYVFSKKLGFADRAKKIARRGNMDGYNSADPFARNSAMRQRIVNEEELTNLMYEQEDYRYKNGLD